MTSPSSPRKKGYERSSAPKSAEDEGGFEDVGLNDDVKPKKRGIFSRFGDFSSNTNNTNNMDTTAYQTSNNNTTHSSHLGLHLPGRKRDQSDAGAELSAMKAPVPVTEKELV